MDNLSLLKARRKKYLEILKSKSKNELQQLRDEWEKLYNLARKSKIKHLAQTHLFKIELIDEALGKKSSK